MGLPAEISPSQRAAVRRLAAAVIAAVTEDEAMPIFVEVKYDYRSENARGFEIACVPREDVEVLVMQMAQEICALQAENEQLHAAQSQPPFYREMWIALVTECQVLNQPDHQQAAMRRIRTWRESAPSHLKARADEWHGEVIKLTEQLLAMTAARDSLADIAERYTGADMPLRRADEVQEEIARLRKVGGK